MLPVLAGPEGVAAWTGLRGPWRPPGPSAFTMWQAASGLMPGGS